MKNQCIICHKDISSGFINACEELCLTCYDNFQVGMHRAGPIFLKSFIKKVQREAS